MIYPTPYNDYDKVGARIIQLKSESEYAKFSEHYHAIPKLISGVLKKQVFSYLDSERKRVLFNPATNFCIEIDTVKFFPMMSHQYKKVQNSNTSLIELIEHRLIYPFLLFVNGRMIPWECINLICSCGFNYLFIHDLHVELARKVRSIENMELMVLPSNIYYSINVDADDEYQSMMTFNLMGEFTDGDDKFHRIYYPNDYIHIVSKSNIQDGVIIDLTAYTDGAKKKLFEENFFFWDKDNLFTTIQSLKILGGKMKIDIPTLYGRDLNGISYTPMTMRGFIYSNTTEGVDNLSMVEYKAVKDDIEAYLKDPSSAPEYFNTLKQPFNLHMDTDKLYVENRKNAIDYILNYRTDLFYVLYDLELDFFTLSIDYDFMLNHRDSDGYFCIPRRWNREKDYYILIFVNGKLYKHYKHHFYRGNMFYNSITSIEPDDTIELLFFKNVDRYMIHSMVNENDPLPLSDKYFNDNTMIYCKTPHESTFTYPKKGSQAFPVDFRIDWYDGNNRVIRFTDPWYYGKEITFAPRSTFRYYVFYQNDPDIRQWHKINLDNRFMYCNDYNRFMIFRNGIRLNRDQYRLTVPCRPTTPFYSYELYLTTPIEYEDTIEIFYLPCMVRDLDVEYTLSDSGVISLNKEDLVYFLGSRFYLFWMNGKKIPLSGMKDIDSLQIQLTMNTASRKHLKITQMGYPIYEIQNAFNEADESMWDKAIREFGGHKQLLGTRDVYTDDSEVDIYAGCLETQNIMWELIRDHFVSNTLVDITGPFIYDYFDQDNTAIDGYDQGDNAILDATHAEREDNIDQINRYYP